MKNSLINRNTTILVLIILVLGFIYMNLENDKTMSGGSVDCSAFIPIVKKLIDKDVFYSYTIGSTPGFVIYIIVVLILTYFALAYVRYQVFLEGYGLPGYSSAGGMTILDYAKMGLFKFYVVRNDTFFYNSKTAGSSGTTTEADSGELIELVNTLKTPSYKPIVDNFCEALAPCSSSTPCACPGSKNCNSNTQHFRNVIEHLGSPSGPDCNDPTLSPSQSAICYKTAHAHQFYPIVPKCCCVISQQTYSSAATKANPGDPNPNYGKNIAACATGSATIGLIQNSLNTPGVSASGSLPDPDHNPECDNVDCSVEPDYSPLERHVFTPGGGIDPDVLQEGRNILHGIIQNTPASTLQELYQMSTYSAIPGANPNITLAPSITSSQIVNNTPSPYPDMVNHLNNQFESGLSNLDSNSALNSYPVPPTQKPASGFTSKLPKNAKKIKKNKK